jgi:hypothetical protein
MPAAFCLSGVFIRTVKASKSPFRAISIENTEPFRQMQSTQTGLKLEPADLSLFRRKVR